MVGLYVLYDKVAKYSTRCRNTESSLSDYRDMVATSSQASGSPLIIYVKNYGLSKSFKFYEV